MKLHIDIWVAICRTLAARQDFTTLLSFAYACHTFLEIGLKHTYRNHDLILANTDASALGKKKQAVFWRSIILSSINGTAFPYCLWIKSLKFGELDEILSDMISDPVLYEVFFRGGMHSFQVFQAGLTSAPPRLDIQQICNKAGDRITQFVKDASDRENRDICLTNLEGQFIPMEMLPTWASRLASLTSLRIQDGSVVGKGLGEVVRSNCPGFRELTCFYCDGPSVDEDLASFLSTIRPNSLNTFSVSSKNRLGAMAFSALSLHAGSLVKLRLAGLQTGAFQYLGALQLCVSLVSLELEGERTISMSWGTAHPASFVAVVSWLGSCSRLTSLKLWHVPSATTLLNEVFQSATLRLRTLDLNLLDEDERFYTALGNQTSLETLLMRNANNLPEYPSESHDLFVDSLCNLRSLKVLDLLQTALAIEDVEALAECLEQLEEFSFDGEFFDDSVFESLAKMTRLWNISISAGTIFTRNGIFGFLFNMKQNRSDTSGFSLSILNQTLEARLSPQQVRQLVRQAHKLGGRLEIEHVEESDSSE